MKLKGGYKDRAIKTKDIVPNEIVTLRPQSTNKPTKSFTFIFVFRYISKILVFTCFDALNDNEPDVFYISETICLYVDYVLQLLE